MAISDLTDLRRRRLRSLPAVDRLVGPLAQETPAAPRPRVVEAVRATLQLARRRIEAAATSDALEAAPAEAGVLLAEARGRLAALLVWHLDRVLNATGIVLHTNLGRASLSDSALERLAVIGRRYSNLELDVRTKARGSRHDHVEGRLGRLTGAEATLVVNNNAAAVLLVLDTLARGREVVVSRGELVEIGGAFRVPDIMARSGARLVEVGTTNRTRLADYARALTSDTALFLKVHPSNYRVLGFTESVTTGELAGLARQHGIPLVEDLGSGCLLDLRPLGLPPEPTVPDTVAAGADLVTFSGDKLLGGPQAGLIVGRRDLVARLAGNPLTRALRIDKLTLAALEGTLDAYEDPVRAWREVPTLRMLAEPEAAVRARARRCARRVPGPARAALGLSVTRDVGQVGGGALPLAELPTAVIALGGPRHPAESLDARLRAGPPPVIGRIAGERLLLDCRTIADDEVPLLARAIAALADPSRP
jgi:L-seryl-tRNA(Ser) seleniumtransferase